MARWRLGFYAKYSITLSIPWFYYAAESSYCREKHVISHPCSFFEAWAMGLGLGVPSWLILLWGLHWMTVFGSRRGLLMGLGVAAGVLMLVFSQGTPLGLWLMGSNVKRLLFYGLFLWSLFLQELWFHIMSPSGPSTTTNKKTVALTILQAFFLEISRLEPQKHLWVKAYQMSSFDFTKPESWLVVFLIFLGAFTWWGILSLLMHWGKNRLSAQWVKNLKAFFLLTLLGYGLWIGWKTWIILP